VIRPFTRWRQRLPAPAVHIRNGRLRQPVHVAPLFAVACGGIAALALVVYLLWPTWHAQTIDGQRQFPITVGGMLLNVPADSIRMRLQRRSGAQDRIDLAFAYPALTPPEPPKHISADSLEETPVTVDRLLLSIAVRGDELAPDERVQTIYPRYLDPQSTMQGGLVGHAFLDSSPYRSEDLFTSDNPRFAARCTRDDLTPGICLNQRRIDGVDMTFRFPRAWLAQWRDVAGAMDKLVAQLRTRHS